MNIEERTKLRLLSNANIIFWVSPLHIAKQWEKNGLENIPALSDILEKDVPDRYFLSEKQMKWLREKAVEDPQFSLKLARRSTETTYKGVDRHGQRTVVLDTFNRGGAKEEEAYSLKTNPSPTSSAVVAIRPKDDWFSQHAVYPTEGVGPTLRGNQNDPSPRIVTPVLTPDRAEKRQHGRRFKEPGDPSFTLTGQDIHGVAISFTNPHDSEEERRVNLGDISRTVKPPYGNQQPFVAIGSDKPTVRAGGKGSLDRHAWDTLTDGFRIRRLTPVECERLQSFPDGWTAHGICKKGDIVWTGKYRTRMEIDEDGFEVKRYRPIMTKAKVDGVYPISDTQRYRALGNAVTTSVITFLGRRIMEAWKP